MKKTIAILAVLVIALGCVFAADPVPVSETHNIKLKTNVGVVIPVYQLQFVSGTNTAANQASHTNNTKGTFSAGNKTDSAADIEVLDISMYDISVTFEAYLMNAAKINKVYNLAFSATPFAVKKNGAAAEVDVATTTTVAAGAVNDGVETADGSFNDSVDATFNGTTCTKDTLLATFTVTYEKDPEVDPHTSNTDFYYAIVTMTVTTL